MSANHGTGRWGESETRVFVKLYLDHQCLWDRNHDDYKSKNARESAFRDIIAKFASFTNILMDTGAVRRKLKNLKSTYCQELKAIKERSTPRREYKPSLSWFQEFDRCFRLQSKYNDDEINKNEKNESDVTSQQIWLNQSNANNKDDPEESCMNTDDPFTQDDNYTSIVFKLEPEEQRADDIKLGQPQYKQKLKNQRNNPGDDDNTYKIDRKCKKKKMNNTKEAASKEDEFDIYGKYIASQLREMGLPKALKVQLHIQKLVRDARIGHLVDQE